jgi:hypothetical protein
VRSATTSGSTGRRRWSYQSFCDRVGLRSDRPYILYVCSSLFRGTTFEPAFTERWIQAVRSSADPRLKDIGILVRPHPARLDEWKQVDLTGYHNVAFWGAHPVDAGGEGGLLRLALLQLRGRRDQHQRVHRGRRSSASRCSPSSSRRISENNQEGTLHLQYLLDEDTGVCACLGVSTSTCRSSPRRSPDTAAATPGPRGSWMASCVRSVARRPRRHVLSRPSSTSPRCRRQSGREPERAPAVAHLLLFPLACLLSIHLRTQPWRKRTRNRIRKGYERQKLSILRGSKQLVTDQFISSGKRTQEGRTRSPHRR